MRKLQFSARSRKPVIYLDSAPEIDIPSPQARFIHSMAKQYAQRGTSFAELVQAGWEAYTAAERTAAAQPDRELQLKLQAHSHRHIREAMAKIVSEKQS